MYLFTYLKTENGLKEEKNCTHYPIETARGIYKSLCIYSSMLNHMR